jgi:hypothetical protein
LRTISEEKSAMILVSFTAQPPQGEEKMTVPSSGGRTGEERRVAPPNLLVQIQKAAPQSPFKGGGRWLPKSMMR